MVFSTYADSESSITFFLKKGVKLRTRSSKKWLKYAFSFKKWDNISFNLLICCLFFIWENGTSSCSADNFLLRFRKKYTYFTSKFWKNFFAGEFLPINFIFEFIYTYMYMYLYNQTNYTFIYNFKLCAHVSGVLTDASASMRCCQHSLF